MSTLTRPHFGRAVELVRQEISDSPGVVHLMRGKVDRHVDLTVSRLRPLALLVRTLFISRLRDPINLVLLVGLPVLIFWVCVAAAGLLPTPLTTQPDTFVAAMALFVAVCAAGLAFGMRSAAHAQVDGSDQMLGSMPFSKSSGWAIDVLLGALFSLTSAVTLVIVATAPVYDLGIKGNVPALVLPVTVGHLLSYHVGRLGSVSLPGPNRIAKVTSSLALIGYAVLAVGEVFAAGGGNAPFGHLVSVASPLAHLRSAITQTLSANVSWVSVGVSIAYIMVFTVAVMTATRVLWSQLLLKQQRESNSCRTS